MPTDVAEELHQILLERGLTIAVAESLTVGLVMSHLGSCSGSSAYFLGGICAYNLDQKVELLGVDGRHASECNCVSQETALEMANGVRRKLGADVGIATTGYAEADPERGIDLPMAWIAMSFRPYHYSVMIEVEEDREGVQEAVAYEAISHLVAWLKGLET